ncbi:MAG: hypothetical protein PHX27_04075 [Candidatus ainarchaeum sp.]|nr:hypothetical protein [Candidatus ainarchaeum sp.]
MVIKSNVVQPKADFEDLILDKDKVGLELKNETTKFDELQRILSKENRVVVELNQKLPDLISGQILINCDPVNNHDFLIGISKVIIKSNLTPLIILTSTNYKTIMGLLNVNKIDLDKVFLVDTVSKNISIVKESDKLFFVDSLRNLTQLQIKLFKLINSNKVVFVFDSIDVLNLYHSEKTIFKFVYSLAKLMRKFKTNGFYIVNNKSLIQKVGQFCDDIIEIGKID